MSDSSPDEQDVDAMLAAAEALEAAAAAAEAKQRAAEARLAVAKAKAKATAAKKKAKAPVSEEPLVAMVPAIDPPAYESAPPVPVSDVPLVAVVLDPSPTPPANEPVPPAPVPEVPLVELVPKLQVTMPAGDAAQPDRLPTSDALVESWLSPAASVAAERDGRSLGESIGAGDVVITLPGIASEAELEALLVAGVAACEAQRARTGREPPKGTKDRFSVSDPLAFSSDVVLSCEEILLRVLDRVDEQLPSVYDTLFRPGAQWLRWQPLTARGQPPAQAPPEHLSDTCPSLRDLYMAGELEWSEGEPAINVYTESGRFGPHQDHMALTVLVPLTCPTRFSGGGTGFWASEDEGGAAVGLPEEMIDDNKANAHPQGPPSAVLRPALGEALVFGGEVTHAGMPVGAGLRSVLVASFSTRTPASAADRINGLQAGSSSGSLREYSF